MSVLRPPREGITLEYLFRPAHRVLLQPLVPASLLLLQLKYPGVFQRALSLIGTSVVQSKFINPALVGLLTLGILDRLNTYLSRQVLNNFVRDKSWDWDREILLITGGCSGIGEEMVRQFAERNIKVVILDVNHPKAPLPACATFYKTDVTSSQDIRDVAVKIRKDIGHPTVLVNNAGVANGKTILDETEEELQRTFDVNILAHFKMIQEFLPDMIKKNHGHVVTIASMSSFATWAGVTSYAATKAAALAFHEGLAQELRARYRAAKVRTTIVHPVWVRTPLSHGLVKRMASNQLLLEPGTVAEAVVSQVLKCEGNQLILPARFNFVPFMRGWPSWLQEIARSDGAQVIQSHN
ncbi:uncharacterized protein Z519_02107 [Cladophialophora bantiana CBS 173.52]|uniref:Short-chain dehydrogenase/reductase 3 n=1 Tax=Cladophialophora bantiana (strain ATCC 10958 / CBS 173.52 / CDC B-1940 / NIH 8579) TaxID=1442370 RepID=A0A0D2F392_CLAB1|nr:uncharacterized protein Z519_02107 [Cladophialophora bantiana CBS 173.52]KIW96716.1 hypothetical protein Z519_02107 [Cladophialophora bantiana CBS 173.52]